MESLRLEQTAAGDWAVVHNDSRVYVADLLSCVDWMRKHPSFGEWHSIDLQLPQARS